MENEDLIKQYWSLRWKGMHGGKSLRQYLERHGSKKLKREISHYCLLRMQGMHDGKTLEKHLIKRR